MTKPYIPNKMKFTEYVDAIFDNSVLTNNGPLVEQLENRLAEFLGVRNLLLVSSGTAAIQLALSALDIKGHVITTPFSFIATLTSIINHKSQPIFVDIDSESLNIDHNKIADAGFESVEAILPTHVFGNPCECCEIENISKQNNLKLIFDASHCFNTKYKGRSLLSFGDVSTLSFHATKIFHTVEGGALVCRDDDVYQKAKAMRNFGFDAFGQIQHVGTNAKMSELHAAMGLCVLDDISLILANYKNAYLNYEARLSGYLSFQKKSVDAHLNHSYAPVLFENEKQCLMVKRALETNNIFARRYFYPSLDTLGFVNSAPQIVSRDVSSRILCLPISSSITDEEQTIICEIVKSAL